MWIKTQSGFLLNTDYVERVYVSVGKVWVDTHNGDNFSIGAYGERAEQELENLASKLALYRMPEKGGSK